MQYHCGVVGPDHLLLGLYRTQGSIAAYVLHELGLTGKQIEDALLKVRPAEAGEPREEVLPATAQLLEQVALGAVDSKKSVISTDDLLMGIVSFNDVVTQAFLAELNLTADRVRDQLAKIPTEIHPLSAISESHQPLTSRVSRFAPLERLISAFWSYLSEAGRFSRRQNASDRFTQSASQMMSVAQEIALKHHRGIVGADHILLAMFRDGDSAAGRVLRQFELTEQQIETAMLKVKPELYGDPIMQLDDEAKHVLERTVGLARKLGSTQLDTEHFLLAIIETTGSHVKALFSELNLTADRLREEIAKVVPSSVNTAVAKPRLSLWQRLLRLFG